MMVIQLLKRSSGNYVRHCFGGAVASLACEYHTTARHWCAQNADHFATSSPFSAFFIEVVCDLGAIPPRTTAAPPPIGGNCIIRGTTRRRHAASDLLVLQNPHRHWCGRRRRDRGAWLRCPWAVAVPGWAIHSDPAPLVWRAPEGPRGQAAVPVGGGGAWPGFEPTRRAKLAARTARGRAAAHGHIEQPGPTAGPSGAWNTRGATSAAGTPAGPQAPPEQRHSTQRGARSAAAPRAPRVCQWLTG